MVCFINNIIYHAVIVFDDNLDEIYIDSAKITIINLHHDANETIGFIIEETGKKLVYITDTGFVDQKYYPMLENADMYIMESNYDIELLWSSDRRFDIKKRIANK